MSNTMQKTELQNIYEQEMVPKLMEVFGYKNKMMIPKITKVVVSMGLGDRDIKQNVADLTMLSGQKAVATVAKKSVAQFKVRKGSLTGAKVTLRGQNKYHFINRLINVALLNDRFFMGLSEKSINLQKYATISLGIRDKKIFPEVKHDSIKSEGLNITLCSNATDKKVFKELLKMFGFPFKEDK